MKIVQNHYDFITATEVVEHLRSPRETYQLLDRLLNTEEAYLGVMTQFLEAGVNFETWWYHKDLSHVCFYQKETFEWLGRWLGWEPIFPAKNVVIYRKRKVI